ANCWKNTVPTPPPTVVFLVLEVYRREASTEEAVAKYGRVLSEKVVRLFDESQSVERYCYLRQDWEMTEVEPGDLVHVTGEFDMTSGICILDNQTDQYIVVHPDTLVSGTTVAGATRCLRRSILNERFRTEDTNEAMLIGTLLHDLFDKAMQSKGKVDATVEVKIDRRPKIHRHRPDTDNSVETCVVPLELKTGKLLSKLGSVDHRAQVILYTLLLSDRHRHPVDSGVLYYMKSTHMIGIPALVHEKRALIMSRNEVARYLSPGRMTSGRQMPGMLKETHTCSRCSQAQNCTLFHKSVENGDRVTSGIGDTFDKLTQHLTSDHTRFFAHWFKLVCLEGKEVQQSSKTSQHHIWSMKGLDREALGQCISGLVLTSHDIQMENDNMYMHKFERSADHPSQTPLVELPLSTGERVVISEEQNNVVAIATGKNFIINIVLGYIQDVKPYEMTVSLDRDLLKCYRSPTASNQVPVYRLDKNHGYNTLTTPWSNIARLLHKDRTRNDELRRLVIDLKPPIFARSRQALINFGSQSSIGCVRQDSQESKITPKYHDTLVESLMEGLNTDQKRAITKVLCAEDYTLILGMPGTGKTTTIARLVQILVARGKSVLLTSYTHTAVDNILLKLKQVNLDFLRLGQVHKMLPEIQPYSTQVAGAQVKTVNDLREFYMSKNVVATTCLGVNHALFSQRSFDYCIVDEASQVTLPVCLGPLHHANVFVLVGDHYQLPPLVQSLEAREGGMDVSLFKRLSEHHPQAVVCLEHQYRMHEDIMALSNALIYENRLKCGTKQVSTALLDIPLWNDLVSWFSTRDGGATHGGPNHENWLLRTLNPCHPVIFLNTDKVPGETLGQEPRESCDVIEINTVDKYQGRDKACILLSLVRSNESSSVGDLLKDWRRVNVAVTRAKSKLILIGSLSTLKTSLLLNELFVLMKRKKWICDLPKDAHKMYVDLERPLKDFMSQ
ncbi:hypothetical protein QZH41_008231, partial [Actinostola sp. cb2023]